MGLHQGLGQVWLKAPCTQRTVFAEHRGLVAPHEATGRAYYFIGFLRTYDQDPVDLYCSCPDTYLVTATRLPQAYLVAASRKTLCQPQAWPTPLRARARFL